MARHSDYPWDLRLRRDQWLRLRWYWQSHSLKPEIYDIRHWMCLAYIIFYTTMDLEKIKNNYFCCWLRYKEFKMNDDSNNNSNVMMMTYVMQFLSHVLLYWKYAIAFAIAMWPYIWTYKTRLDRSLSCYEVLGKWTISLAISVPL